MTYFSTFFYRIFPIIGIIHCNSYAMELGGVFTKNKQLPTFELPHSMSSSHLNQHDFHQAIEKMRQSSWVIRNDTSDDVDIKLLMSQEDFEFSTLVTMLAGQSYTTFSEEKIRYVDIRFWSLKNGMHSIHSKEKATVGSLCFSLEKVSQHYEIVITKNEKRVFPQSLENPNFIPILLKHPTKNYPELNLHIEYSDIGPSYPAPYGTILYLDPTEKEISFIDQYNNHLVYLINWQFYNEKIDASAFFVKLNQIFAKNSLEALFFPQDSLINKKITHLKIPAITHTIWFTSPDNPKEYPDEYLYWLEKSIEANPQSHGFKHLFWVLDKTKLPKTVKALKKMNVKVQEIKKMGDFKLKKSLKKEIVGRKFGRASDIFRTVVLDKMGGIYKDTDYRLHQSLLVLLEHYDFIGCREPMSIFVGNAFIASRPHHPIILKNMEIIERNYDLERSPKYIKDIPESDGFKTILLTGPAVMTTAVAKAIGEEGYTDIIMPHERLYPCPKEGYPLQDSVKPDLSVPLSAFGTHYWETSWADLRSKTFGSFG